MRLIDADKLPKYTGMALNAAEIAKAVEDAPTVDAEAEIEALKKANEDMYRACTAAEGRAADLELEVGNLKEKIWDLENSEEDEYAETT